MHPLPAHQEINMKTNSHATNAFLGTLVLLFLPRFPSASLGQKDFEQQSTLEIYQETLTNLIGNAKVDELNKTSSGKRFLTTLLDNKEWLHDLIDSGPIHQPGLVMDRLKFLWEKDQTLDRQKHTRTLATAVALEYGGRKRTLDAAWVRYQFYRDSFLEKRLHPVYETLETWEKRYLAGHRTFFHGEPASQRWLRDNVKLPIRGYYKVCWRIPYRSYNFLGDSVQKDFYYTPFQGSFGCFSQMAIYVGGVCGRLSGLGAAAAVANGIPATTMGEPAHCAYTVRTARGQWTACYSLSWRRDLHTSMYSPKYSELTLFDRIFEKKSRLRESQELRLRARLLQNKSPKKSIKQYQAALRVHPIHVGIWTEYGRFLKSQQSSVAEWKTYHNALVDLLSDYPETLWRLLNQHAYPNLLDKLSANDKVVLFGKFHRNIKKWGPARWDFEACLNQQLTAIGNHTNLRKRFIEAIAISHADSTAYGGPALGWAVSKVNKDPEQIKELLSNLSEQTFEEGNADAVTKNMSALTARLIKDAQKNNDMETYDSAGALLEKTFGPYPKLVNPPFPGELVSQRAFVRYSGLTDKRDNGSQHYWLGSSRPGFIHANWGNDVWISLEFKHFAEITGIQLDRNVHNRGNDIPLAIDVSEDGETWTEIDVVRENHAVNNIDLQGKNIQARFVRLRHLRNQSIHLKNVRVFGNKRS